MFDIFKPFFGPSSYLGIDIGTTSIKIAEISKKANGLTLSNYGILETYGHLTRLNSAIQTSSLKMATEETAGLLKTLIEKGKFKTNEVVASLPAFSSFVTYLEIPKMTDSETQKALSFQIPQYIPLPMTETSIDWLKIGERQDEKGITKQQVLVISVPNEKIVAYQNIFKQAGLKLKAVEIESLSTIRSVMRGIDATTLIVDIGSRSTNILVSEKQALRYSGQTDFAGASLTQSIASGLGIDIRRAEEMKKQKGIIVTGAEYELSTLTLTFLDAIINEAKRIKDTYEKNQAGKVEQVVLSGGGANLIGIQKYFEEQIGLRVLMANPFSLVGYPKELETIIGELGLILGVSIGLGIKNLLGKTNNS